jgi:adenine-specific DNA methylase
MDTDKRLIDVAFPLIQTSIDSVHEKNVRHGHISTLHIWPARRPLAACRAALLATLLPDPGTPEERARLLEKIGGRVVRKGTQAAGEHGGATVGRSRPPGQQRPVWHRSARGLPCDRSRRSEITIAWRTRRDGHPAKLRQRT